jgi:hypothetical protein
LANNQKKKKKSHTYRNDNHNDLYEENVELKEALSRVTFRKANDISKDEIEFRIPKEKGPNLADAIQKCENSVYVVFDRSGVLERAVPDIYRGK